MQSKIKIKGVYPLLPAQRGFLVDSFAGGDDQYRQQICVEIEEPVSADSLRANIRKIVATNQLLRTIFDWSDGQPVQVVIDGIEPVIHTLSGTKGKAALSAALKMEKDALQPVSDAPPIRFMVIEGRVKLLLAITYHHILLDGPSVDLLLEQIVGGIFSPEVPVGNYLSWQAQNVGAKEYAAWEQLLTGLDRRDGVLCNDDDSDTVKRYHVTLDTSFYNKVLARAKKRHSTPATYLQVLWSEWALSYFGKKSLLYGLIVSTRVPGLSDHAIGPYISTVPWLVYQESGGNLDAVVECTQDKMLHMALSKHLPLGDIAKHVSPFAMNFDAILTITTIPIRDTISYKVLETYENTGYKLSVDIEILNDVRVTFSTTLNGMDMALRSFVDYCERQIDRPNILSVNGRYGVGRKAKLADGSYTVNSRNRTMLLDSLAEIFDTTQKGAISASSFLELGGDSITALKLKTRLKSQELDVSVADILQAASIEELAAKISAYDPRQTRSETRTKDSELVKAAGKLFGNKVESVTQTPPAAQAIVNAYRLGYGQDYHEQTAFRLTGAFNREALYQALQKLASEHPTLRLVYPSGLPDLQVLLSAPRTSFKVEKPAKRSFDEFVRMLTQEHWDKPFDIEKGPLLRIVVSQESEDEWYIFMSFSMLVTDGWSFSTLLERLFHIYREVLTDSYVRQAVDPYIEHSKRLSRNPLHNYFDGEVADSNYTSEVFTKDFVIGRDLTARILGTSNKQHRTVSEVLLGAVQETLKLKGFSQVNIYESGRNTSGLFTSVGPYSYISSRDIQKQHHVQTGRKQAYYVFENYPRESENRLKNGEVSCFNELGNWRRNLLPPNVTMGYVFDVSEKTISFSVLLRGGKKPDDFDMYRNALLSTIEKEV